MYRSPGNHSRKRGAGQGLVLGIERVQFRVTLEQRQELEAEAAAQQKTVGDVARARIFAAASPPSRARRRPAPTTAAPTTKGYRRGVLAVVLRVTQEQRAVLEAEAAKRQLPVGTVARELCFRAGGRAPGG